jgi:hypothetical protein
MQDEVNAGYKRDFGQIKMEGSTAATKEPSILCITCCCLKFLFAMLCYLFFLPFFFVPFFFFAIICYLHMAQQTGLILVAMNSQETPSYLSKRPISVVIIFIVQIIKNPS